MVPNQVAVISKEEKRIIIRANMKDAVPLGYDDSRVDGDLLYTFIAENGYWVLETTIGKDADAAKKVFPVEKNLYKYSDNLSISPLLYEVPGNQLDDITIIAMSKSLFEQCSSFYYNWYLQPLILSDTAALVEYDGATWYQTEYITSINQYQTVFESIFSKDFYKSSIEPTLDNWVMERDGALYFALSRVLENGKMFFLTPKQITIQSKSEKEIVINVIMRVETDLTGFVTEDQNLQYSLLVENGHWVLNNWNGKRTDT